MMDENIIAQIIQKHGLKPGDRMRNVNGGEIANSLVMSDYNVLIENGDRYELHNINVITGKETIITFTPAEVETLRKFNPAV
jgi:hypothetical protein